MTRSREWSAACRLTRPRQWPILSAQFAVGVCLALPRLEFWGDIPPATAAGPLLAGWLAWVVLLNGGTLAFNSACDRDTGPVAYLLRPPAPPGWLAPAALLWMMGGVGLGTWLVGWQFGLVTAMCAALSVAYSHPAVRLKGRSGLDLLTNMVGYGAGTTAAGILTGQAALGGNPAFGSGQWLFCLTFALLFGSFYPLSQIYQIECDRRNGDRTLATRLGQARSLDVALVLGLAAVVPLLGALVQSGRLHAWPMPVTAMAFWTGHLLVWRRRAHITTTGQQERGMYRALWLWAGVDLALLAAWLT